MTILILGNINHVYASVQAPFDLAQIPWVFEVESDLNIPIAMGAAEDLESIVSSIDVSSDTECLYSIRQFIAYDSNTIYGISVWDDAVSNVFAIDVSGTLGGSYRIGLVQGSVSALYSITAPVESLLRSQYSLNVHYGYTTANIIYSGNVYSDTVSEYATLGLVQSYLDIPYTLKSHINRDLNTIYELDTITLINKDVTCIYTVYDDSSESISLDVTATVDGDLLDFDTISLSSDEDSYCWSFSAQLSNADSWSRCPVGARIYIMVGADTYAMQVDSRNRNTEFGSNSFYIEGRSITSVYGEGAEPIYKTWGVTDTNSVVHELIPTEVTINIPSWNLPAGLLVSDGDTPIAVVATIAEAVGGCVYTTSGGVLVLERKYKVAPPEYVLTEVDHSISDLDDIYSIAESREFYPGYNQVEVTDEPDVDSVSINIEEISKNLVMLTALIKVTIYPFTDYLELASSHDFITMGPSTTPIFEELTETIEIINGSGNVSSPIFNIISSDYQDADMGALQIDGNDITTELAGTTLLNVTYRTQYHLFNVLSQEPEKVQIYKES